MAEQPINNTVKAAEECRHGAVVYYHTCPKCGDETDEYTDSMKGETYECICGANIEVIGK